MANILSILAVLLSFTAFIYVLRFVKKFRGLLVSSNGQSLENNLARFLSNLDTAENEIDAIKKTLAEHDSRIGQAVSRVGVVRYNPFKDTGGDLSFSAALLNEKKDGFIISSIHGREGTRIYTKQISGGESAHNLSGEEKQALTKALEQR